MIALQGFDHVISLPGTFFVGQHGSFDGCGLNHAKDLSADSFIYGDATERDATRFAVIEQAAEARIPQYIVPVAGIPHRQLTSTSPASQEPNQQRVAILGSAGLGFSLVVLLIMRWICSNSSQLT